MKANFKFSFSFIAIVLLACGSGSDDSKDTGMLAQGEECSVTGAGCEAELFCAYPVGSCGENAVAGKCEVPAEICPELYSPVCGCDGKTYSSLCHASGARISVRYAGECSK